MGHDIEDEIAACAEDSANAQWDEELEKAIEKIKQLNPYPEDVFPKMKNQDIKQIVKIMALYGFTPDRYSAHLMRIAYNNAKEDAIKILKDVNGWA